MPDVIFIGTMGNVTDAVLQCIKIIFNFAEQNPFIALMFLAIPFVTLLLDVLLHVLGRGQND